MNESELLAALAEAREARWGAEYAADSAAEEAEKAIAALSCALVEAERQRDEALTELADEKAVAAGRGKREIRWRDRAVAAEAALADTREALRAAVEWVVDAADRGDQLAEAELSRCRAVLVAEPEAKP